MCIRDSIYPGRLVEARVIAVAEKVLRVEAFGIECAIFARDLSWQWVSDARDLYSVGDRVLVRVQEISGEDAEHLSIRADIRSTFSETSVDNLKKCQVQSKYAGKVTDLRGGVVYILSLIHISEALLILHNAQIPSLPWEKPSIQDWRSNPTLFPVYYSSREI